MNNITTYYIPTNPNITSGQIYTLYINKNTNLDLTTIINDQPNTKNIIEISENSYHNLLQLNEEIEQNISHLIELNTQYKTYLKKITLKGDRK